MTLDTPTISIIIPIHNEEAILHTAIVDLQERLQAYPWTYEIILSENGSKDQTTSIAHDLINQQTTHGKGIIRLISLVEPNYGNALKQGILTAQGEFVICDEIDLGDVHFYQEAITLLQTHSIELVVGSKLVLGAEDQRPLIRHLASQAYCNLLKLMLGFRGTDTHGLKAFRRSALLDIVHACVTDKDVFASELVIRADRAHKRIQEIPVRIVEKRPPSINLFKRVPNVLKNIAKLTYTIRVQG
ncbi:glycosyltransferase [Pajaroellobacter abortibovis]|uniref:Glycosyl transferase family 2 n=1 Tax=Pajaroellobacter abortibovis TaxID=1882918 RepID=A0A1L6MVI8_9BACT|nr:glycosyltransferase [Pajaroellobacter abortibovis]APR99560.1 glycosyl transferase family 2 [Pajaroellobacter abortibovis]